MMTKNETDYRFSVVINCTAEGSPRPVQLAARIKYLIQNSLKNDGFELADNAVDGIYIECIDLTYVCEEDDESHNP